MRIFSPAAFLAALCLFSFSAAAGTESLKIEGIISGDKPGEYAAMINGEVVQKGGRIGSYEVLQVGLDGVRLKETKTGEESFLAVGARSASIATGPGGKKETAPPPPQKNWLQQAMEKHMPDLSKTVGQFEYAKVVQDLKKIHFEAMIESVNSGRAVSFGDLIAKGKLPAFMAKGEMNGYRYRIQNVAAGVRVSADPVEKDSVRKHFLMDEHSYVYAEEKKPATPLSPRFNSGYSIEVLPST